MGGKKQMKSREKLILFVLFPEPRSHITILIYRKWPILLHQQPLNCRFQTPSWFLRSLYSSFKFVRFYLSSSLHAFRNVLFLQQLMIRLHSESSQQNDRKMGSFSKLSEIENTQTRATNVQDKALQLSWLFLRAFFPLR